MKKIYKYLIALGGTYDGDEVSMYDVFVENVEDCFKSLVSVDYGVYDEYDVTTPDFITPAQIIYQRVYNRGTGGVLGVLIKSTNPYLETRGIERVNAIGETARKIASSAIASEGGLMLDKAQRAWGEVYYNVTAAPTKTRTIDTTTPTITTQQSGGTSNTKTRKHEDVYKTTGTARPTAEESETNETDAFNDTRRTITTHDGSETVYEQEYHDMSYDEAIALIDGNKKIGTPPFERVANRIIAMLVPMDETDRAIAEARGSAWWGSDEDLIILE